jgi:hypothetical protein
MGRSLISARRLRVGGQCLCVSILGCGFDARQPLNRRPGVARVLGYSGKITQSFPKAEACVINRLAWGMRAPPLASSAKAEHEGWFSVRALGMEGILASLSFARRMTELSSLFHACLSINLDED